MNVERSSPILTNQILDLQQRIAALESAVNNISAELGGWLAHEKRIGALEVELREFNNWALKRIAKLEDEEA
jgi:hypothetical protein